MNDDEKPTPDSIEQQRPVRPDDTEDEPPPPGLADAPVDADPADVAEQHRIAPVPDDDEEPGP